MKNKNVKISSPWVCYRNMINAMFASDPEIIVGEVDENYNILITCTNQSKYDVLTKVLRSSIQLGNIHLTISFKLESKSRTDVSIEDFNILFAGNNIFKETISITDPIFGTTFNYVAFSKKVIQYYDDLLTDPHGLMSILAQDIAPIIFDTNNISYCTTDKDE
jgi:hypothetical protein